MNNLIEDKIKKLMSIVFEINLDEISDNFSQINSKDWDSLRHLNLIVALEEEFDIIFTDNEITSLNSYKEIIDIVKYRKN
jgi:acyl carrier protein